jgi:hypothetical protein
VVNFATEWIRGGPRCAAGSTRRALSSRGGARRKVWAHASMTAGVPTRCGRKPMRRRFGAGAKAPSHCRCCWHCGPVSVRATCSQAAVVSLRRTYIRLWQGKTKRRGKPGVRVVIPVGAALKVALDAAAKVKKGPIILISTDSRPWTSDGFRSSWRKACAKAGVIGVTFHDLRARQ